MHRTSLPCLLRRCAIMLAFSFVWITLPIIATVALALEAGSYAITTGSDLRMRVSPDLDSKVVDHLNKGVTVKILQRSQSRVKVNPFNDYFYKVQANNGTVGWVYGHYLKETTGRKTGSKSSTEKKLKSTKDKSSRSASIKIPGFARSTGDRVRFRSSPDSDSRVVGKLIQHQKVKVLERSKSLSTIDGIQSYWYKIETQYGSIGWLFGAYLKESSEGSFKKAKKKIEAVSKPRNTTKRSNRWYPGYQVVDFFPLPNLFYLKWSMDPWMCEMRVLNHWQDGANLNWECILTYQSNQPNHPAGLLGCVERYATTDLRLINQQHWIDAKGNVHQKEITVLQRPFGLGYTWRSTPEILAKIVDVHYALTVNQTSFQDCMVVALYERDSRDVVIRGESIKPGWFCTYQYWQPHVGLVAEKMVRSLNFEDLPDHKEVHSYIKLLVESYSLSDILVGEWSMKSPIASHPGRWSYQFGLSREVVLTIIPEGLTDGLSSSGGQTLKGKYYLEDQFVSISFQNPIVQEDWVHSIPRVQEWEVQLKKDRFIMTNLEGLVLSKLTMQKTGTQPTRHELVK